MDEREKITHTVDQLDPNLLKHLLASQHLGIFTWTRDGSIVQANDAFLRMIGYTQEELAAGHLNWQDLTPAEYSAQDERLSKRLTETGQGTLVEKQFFHKNGGRIPILISGIALDDISSYGIAFVIDITEHKEIEGELKFVLAHAHCLLWFGAVTETDERTYEWDTHVIDEEHAEAFCPLEIHPDEGYTQAWYRHRLHEGKIITDNLSISALRSNQTEYQAEFGVRNRLGAVQWFDERVYVEPLRPTAEGNRRWRVVGVCMDISERRQTAQRLKSALEKEQHIARTLQRSLLQVPPPDAFPGIRVKRLYEPAYGDLFLGGDFVDVFSISNERVALIVGDATGKGLEAAAYTAQVKFAIRAFLREDHAPAEALKRLNAFLIDAARFDWERVDTTYLAVSIATIHLQSGELKVSSAGMEPPFVYHPGTKAVTMLEAGGLLLGVEQEASYDTDTLILQKDDLLTITTDGLTEAFDGNSFFGHEGLISAISDSLAEGRTLTKYLDNIINRARAFAHGHLKDDVCLLLTRFGG